ncbi:MAG: acyl--CoA ligase [Mogibacterium sp.]|nr:acyl--CoA ligase [Mogibacterium sp.]
MYSIYRKFSSFEELVNDFLARDGIAIRCGDMAGETSEVSYREFGEMIISESFLVKAECSSVEVVRYEQNVDSLVDIFAHVIAGCDVIIADPRVPEGFNEFAAQAAETARYFRENQRDEFGRIKGKGGEGELLFFTSGTTSSSKIVRLTSRSLCTSAWSGQSMLSCGKGDVILSNLSLSHAYGFVCAMLWGLAYGATVALGRSILEFTGDALFFDPTIIPSVPSQMADMIRKDALNPGLKTVLIGGAPCPQSVVDALREKGIQVYLGYGLTETSSGIAITQDLDEPDAMYPCPEADIRIEEDGEISVATPCMMQGYLGRDPMFENGRFYTGDIGWFDEKGRLHLKGRKNDVLVLPDGDKIFCPEYEESLEQVSGLPDLGVILKDGEAVLVVGTCPKDPAIAADIRKKLVREVDRFNRSIPHSRQISDIIMTPDALPRTVTGKLKRHELQEMFI